jgi:membrane associated rhomboid family serine protease
MFPYADNNPTKRPSYITWALMLINTIIFLVSLQLTPEQLFEVHAHRGFIPARMAQLQNPQLVIILPAEKVQRLGDFLLLIPAELRLMPDRGEICLSLFTSLFMHGSWLHLLGNMLFLMIFGNNIEDRLGHGRFLFFYLIGGVFASLCHWLTNIGSPVPTIGASGAVAAIMGAYMVTWPRARIKTLLPLGFILIPIELPALIVLGFWFGGQLIEGLKLWRLELGGGVAFWAHIGGFAFGALLMLLVNRWGNPEGESPEYRALPDYLTDE